MRRILRRLRPYRLLTPTVGRVEQIRLLRGLPEPLIEWRWWARLPFVRRFARPFAWQAATDLLNHEWEGMDRPPESDVPKGSWSFEEAEADSTAPQAFACDLAAIAGHGMPEQWRAVRLRDAVYLARLISWRADPETEEPRPQWGET